MDPTIAFCVPLLLGVGLGLALGRAWFRHPAGPTTYHVTNDNRQTHHCCSGGFDPEFDPFLDDEDDDPEPNAASVFPRPWTK